MRLKLDLRPGVSELSPRIVEIVLILVALVLIVALLIHSIVMRRLVLLMIACLLVRVLKGWVSKNLGELGKGTLHHIIH